MQTVAYSPKKSKSTLVAKHFFDEMAFINHSIYGISNLIFTACVACKNPVRNRLKIQFVELDFFSNLILQKSSTDQQGTPPNSEIICG